MTRNGEPVIVIGAGLTGMSTSYHLRSAGISHRIFERSTRAGGLSITNEDSGFRFDVTGHLLHLRNEQMRKLVTELVGEDLLRLERNSVVWSCGGYTRYPYQANTLGLPPQVAYECLMGFLETQQKNADKSAQAEPVKDFEQFCYRYFGTGFSRHFMIPYNSRLWGVHPSEITTAWCSRFVPLPKLEDVIAGAVGLPSKQMGYNATFLYPRKGIGMLSDAFAKKLGNIEFDTSVVGIDSARKCVRMQNGQTIHYDVLVSSAPLNELISMIDDSPSAIIQAAQQLRCSSLWYLDLALDTPALHPYHWVYVPEEKYPFYRVGVYSNFSEQMAPEGKSCMYIELADRSEPNMSELLPRVCDGLQEMGFLERPEQVMFARVRQIKHAYVIFDHDYEVSSAEVLSFLKDRRILSTGRYGGWNYSSMEDALLFGKAAAQWVGELIQ